MSNIKSRIEGYYEKLQDFIQHSENPFAVAARNYTAHDMKTHATNYSFNMFLTLFPFALLLGSIFGFFLSSSPDLFDRINSAMLKSYPEYSQAVRNALNNIVAGSSTVSALSTIMLFWFGTRLFDALENGLSVVYGSPPRPFLRKKIRGMVFIIMLGVLTVLGIGANILAQHFGSSASEVFNSRVSEILILLLGALVSIMSSILLFTLFYMYIPVKTPSFKNILPGTLLASALNLVMQNGVSYYFLNYSSLSKYYGMVGGFLILLTWYYFLGVIIYFCAELNAAISSSARQRSS